MSEKSHRPSHEQLAPMSGDGIIPNPDLAWDTRTPAPIDPDAAWTGRYGLTRMGSTEDGLAGPLLPQRFDPILPPHMRSLAVDAPDPRRLQEGDTVPDGYPGSIGRVVEIDDDRRTMVVDTWWPPKEARPGLHYTWQLTVEPGPEEGTSVIVARTRMKNVMHKTVGKLWPRADRYAMRLVVEGISRNDQAPKVPPTLRQRLGARAIATAGRIKDGRPKKRAR